MIVYRLLAGLALSALPLFVHADAVRIAGSSTLKPTIQAWAQAYQAAHPGVTISVEGEGSGSGFKALAMGQADLVSSSRPVMPYEVDMFTEMGISLQQQVVGHDALSVFVNPANPLKSASLDDLTAIFDELGRVKKWQDLKVSVPGCKSGRIELIGRPENSGTRADFAMLLKLPNGLRLARAMANSEQVIEAIAKDPCAIGYGAFLRSDKIRALCLSGDAGPDCATPEQAIAERKPYPLLRDLFLYRPAKVPAVADQFYVWTGSTEAACLVAKAGFQLPAQPVQCP